MNHQHYLTMHNVLCVFQFDLKCDIRLTDTIAAKPCFLHSFTAATTARILNNADKLVSDSHNNQS